ncbi:Similar to hypothetical protein AN1963.2 [Aspergillus nidulans FGSC A4]; acc. no. XP_659567 [Pyronema omphalodes CBS 100304]|uniref:Uncharacterized protein n=1 Tax=Pyronema omphalodes (strain CBS 100304) TaxID=1076935 RepID=U4LS39_PYROM|nr:Similar to hypothetical protein AN1963.2 [Aspergillus nidulans FGSC A4]; acc. no. XP_659567 [Pyronema omphalodes CBS 100304]
MGFGRWMRRWIRCLNSWVELPIIGLTHHRFWWQLLWMCKSLLPAWAKYRYHKDVTGQELRNAVFLRQRWNEELEKRVDHWAGGKVMLWDAGQWFIDTLRSGRKGGWKDVRSACLEDGKKCEHPERYLMWDDLHLGARAHEIMAKEVIRYLM